MANDLEYRLIVKDDGSIVIKRVGAEVDDLSKKTVVAAGKMASATKESAKGFEAVTGKIKDAKEELTSFDRLVQRVQRTMAAFLAVFVFREIIMGFKALVGAGIDYNAIMEQSNLSIASIYMSQGKFVDTLDRTLEGQEALTAAQRMASITTKQLMADNLKTIATYEQLVKVYSETVAPGLQARFNPGQIREYTLAMVQAAGALGLNLDMLAEETRSMLRGTITPRNTLIATALGIRNEDIARYRADGDQLFKFIMGKLQAFVQAGEVSQNTWKGITSNLYDAFRMVMGEGLSPLFELVKSKMKEIQQWMVQLNVATGEMELNPKLVKSVDNFSGALEKAVGLAEKLISVLSFITEWTTPFPALMDMFGREGKEDLTGKIRNLMDEIRKAKELADKGAPPFLGLSKDRILKDIEDMKRALQDLIKQRMEITKTPLNVEPAEVGIAAFKPSTITLMEDQKASLLALIEALGYLPEAAKKYNDQLMGTLKLKKDIYQLTFQEQVAMLKIGMATAKHALPTKELMDLYDKLVDRTDETIKAQQRVATFKPALEIATITKNYDEQARLVSLISEDEVKILSNTGKLIPGLEQQLRLLGRIQASERDRAGMAEEAKRMAEIAGLRGEFAYAGGNMDEYIRQSKIAFEADIERRTLAREFITLKGQELLGELKIVQLRKESTKVGEYWMEYEKSVLGVQLSTAQLYNDVNAIADISRKQLEVDFMDSVIKKGVASSEDLILRNLKEQALVRKIIVDLTKNFTERMKLSADLESRWAEMTGNLGVYADAQQNILLADRMELRLRSDIGDEERKRINILRESISITETELKKLAQAETILGFRSNIAQLVGDFEMLKNTEAALAKIELQRAELNYKNNIEGLKYSSALYQFKMKEIEATKTMNVETLVEIGIRKSNIQAQQGLADYFQNMIPNAIGSSTQAIGNFFDNLGDRNKSFGESFTTLFEDIEKGIRRTIAGLIDAYLRALILRQVANLYPTPMPSTMGGGWEYTNVGPEGAPGVGIGATAIAPSTEINIMNNTGSPIRAKETGAVFDGRRWVKSIVLELAASDMTFRDTMGLRR